jgi:hypothetical protein
VLVYDQKTGTLNTRWTFGLDTREPSPESVMRKIHNSSKRGYRMALYLPFRLAKELVSPGLTEERYKEILAFEMKSEDLEYYTTDTIRTAKPRKDGKAKDEPFEWPKLPPLGEMNPEPQVLK